MFGLFKRKRKTDSSPFDEALYEECLDVTFRYANACYDYVSRSLGVEGNSDQAQAKILSDPSIVFFRQIVASLCSFCGASEAAAIALMFRIVGEYLIGHSDKETFERIEPIFTSALTKVEDRKVEELTVALWAGNMVAAEIFKSRKVTAGLVAAYVEGVCQLKMPELKASDFDWPAFLRQELIRRYESMDKIGDR